MLGGRAGAGGVGFELDFVFIKFLRSGVIIGFGLVSVS